MIQESLVTFLGEIHHWDIIHSNSFWARNEKCLKPRGFKQNVQRQLLGPVEEEKGRLYCSPGLRGEKGVKRWELPFESRFPGRGQAKRMPVSAARCDAQPSLPGPSLGIGVLGGSWGPGGSGEARGEGARPVRLCVCPRAGTRRVEMAALEKSCKYALLWKTFATTRCFGQQPKKIDGKNKPSFLKK